MSQLPRLCYYVKYANATNPFYLIQVQHAYPYLYEKKQVSTAPQHIKAQNTTSNCWPTLPKSNTLSRIPNTVTDQFNATRNLGEDIGPWITTILTVFYPVNSANGTIPLANVLQQPEAQLTCLKPIDEAGAVDAFIAMVDDRVRR